MNTTMDEKPHVDVVLMVVASLHNNPDKNETEKASLWLVQLQKSVHAWTIADELLLHKRSLESCYFGAQTMRTKIQSYFYELPIDAHTSLRDSLIEHISQINENTYTPIANQLYLSLADLILQMPSWQQPVMDLITKFSQTHTWSLLEILTVLPEELEGRLVRLGDNRRLEIMKNLRSSAPTVKEFLRHCCNTYGNEFTVENIQVHIKVIKCFTSWVCISDVFLQDISTNEIVARVFEVLNQKGNEDKSNQVSKSNLISGTLHEKATDCICVLLQCLEDNNNHQGLELFLFNAIRPLEVPYHLSVASEDHEKSINYCRIFTEFAESILGKIISHNNENIQHYGFEVINLVLMCVGHHDYEVAEVTFNFWYLLSEELYQKNVKHLTDMFRPYIARLITALCRHCQMEPDHEGLLEEGDEFKDFRMKVFDLIKDVIFIVGSTTCFCEMFKNLQSPGVSWDSNEAALFVMQAVAKNILPTDNEIVPQVVQAILNLPENAHVAVRHTSVLLLGELCEWVEQHTGLLDPILNFLVCCLSQPGLGAAAATSLQNICSSCNDHMPRHVPILLQLLQQVDTFSIANSAIIGLLRGVAAIVGHMPRNEVAGVLRQLCLLQTNPLCRLMESDAVIVRASKTDPVLYLDRLSSIFRGLVLSLEDGESNPCKSVALEVWPVLSHTLERYQGELRIMERCCRSIRFMLRCVSQDVPELLQPLVTQLVQLYTSHGHSCFLYLGSILVDEYATNSNCISGLLEMLQAFLTPTFNLLQEENGLRNHPETVDDFFRLCCRLLQRASVNFLRSSALPPIFQCALMACSLDHREANTSVMKFFCDLISTGHSNKSQPDYEERKILVQNIFMQYGAQLTSNLIHACIFYLHSYMLSEVADVIVEMLRFNRDAAGNWLNDALKSLPNQGQGGIVTATPQQLNDFYISVTKSDTSNSITHALKDLTRLYR